MMFIDATANGGVSVTDFNQFIDSRNYDNYTKIVYRSLSFKRTWENQVKLENFLKVSCSLIDRKYLGKNIILIL